MMADESSLDGLLDRAGRVFSLAYQLYRDFHDAHRRQGQVQQVDPSVWSRHRPAFDEFCTAVVELRDPMQNPPVGFAPVARALRDAANAAKLIRDVMQTPDGRTWASYLEYWPHLYSAAQAGWLAIREVANASRTEDPFAFLDQSSVANEPRSGGSPGSPAAVNLGTTCSGSDAVEESDAEASGHQTTDADLGREAARLKPGGPGQPGREPQTGFDPPTTA